MKQIFSCCISLVVILLLLSGCDFTRYHAPFVYTFRQDQSQITKVEICQYTDGYPIGTIKPIVQLPESKIETFCTDIAALECRETKKFDTPTGYGDLIFLVTYQNGEKEIFSFLWVGNISPDGTHTETLAYFDSLEMSKVFAKYVDPKVLFEVSEDFRYWYNQVKE